MARVQLTGQHKHMLSALAADEEITSAEVVRELVEAAYNKVRLLQNHRSQRTDDSRHDRP